MSKRDISLKNRAFDPNKTKNADIDTKSATCDKAWDGTTWETVAQEQKQLQEKIHLLEKEKNVVQDQFKELYDVSNNLKETAEQRKQKAEEYKNKYMKLYNKLRHKNTDSLPQYSEKSEDNTPEEKAKQTKAWQIYNQIK